MIGRVPLDAVQIRQLVAPDLHRVPGAEALNLRRAVGARAGDSDRKEDDCGMDDVAAVAAAVSRDEAREGRPPTRGAKRLAGARSARELEHDCAEREGREGVGEQAGGARAGAEGDQDQANAESREGWSEHRLSERPQRRSPPSDERADPHQQQQGQAEDLQEEVVVRRPDGHRLTANRVREEREGDAPEDGQREGDEQQVVVEEGGLA